MFRRAIIAVGCSLLALGLAGCGADDLSEGATDGGQTGSLVPPCLVESPLPFIVPEGDTAYAQQAWQGLPQLTLTDAAGRVVDTELSTDGTTSIVRTSEALTSGVYTISSECAAAHGETVTVSREITVVEAAPLPTEFGTLGLIPASPRPACEDLSHFHFIWTPSPEFSPYLGLTQLTLFVDDTRRGVVALERPLEADEQGVVHVHVPICPRTVDTCGPTAGRYSFTATITGETPSWSSPQISVRDLCLPSEDDGVLSCALRAGRETHFAPWFLLALAALGFRRSVGRETTSAGIPAGDGPSPVRRLPAPTHLPPKGRRHTQFR